MAEETGVLTVTLGALTAAGAGATGQTGAVTQTLGALTGVGVGVESGPVNTPLVSTRTLAAPGKVSRPYGFDGRALLPQGLNPEGSSRFGALGFRRRA